MAEDEAADAFANLDNAEQLLDKSKGIVEELQKMNDLTDTSAKSWGQAFQDVADQAANAASGWDGVIDGSTKVKDISKQITSNQKTGNDLSAKQSQFIGKITGDKDEQKKIQDALGSGDKAAIDNMSNLSDEQKELLNASQEGITANKASNAELKKQEKAIKNSYTGTVKGLKLIGDVAGKLGLGEISKSFLAGSEAAREAKLAGAGFFGQIKAAAVEMVKVAAQAIIINTILIGLDFNERITELKTTMAVSREEAMGYQKELYAASMASGDLAVNTKRMAEAVSDANEGSMFFKKMTAENAVAANQLQEYYGLSGKQIKSMNDMSIMSGKSLQTQKMDVMGMVAQRRNETGLMMDAKKIMQEVGEVQGYLKASLGANPKLIAEAVMNASELGMTLESTAKIADSLLNFESSISAELEAELLTGKQLNLEKARLYALTNDYVGLQNEVASQVGSLAEFNDMNRLSAEAMAKAFGMSRDEMAEMLMDSEIAGQSAEQLREAGKDELADMVEKRSLQEGFNDLVAKLKDIFVNEIGPFIEDFTGNMEERLPGAMDMVTSKIKTVAKWFNSLDTSKFFKKEFWMQIRTQFRLLGLKFKEYFKIAKTIAKVWLGLQATMYIIKGIQFATNAMMLIYQGYQKLSVGYAKARNLVESKGLVKAVGMAVMKAISSLSAIPFVGFALGVVAGAAVAGLAAAYLFEDGGVVPGTSTTGDQVPAMVNSGEMILNKEQQGNLFSMAQGGGGDRDYVTEEPTAGMGAEVVIDSFNMSSYGNLGRMNEKYQNPYLA